MLALTIIISTIVVVINVSVQHNQTASHVVITSRSLSMCLQLPVQLIEHYFYHLRFSNHILKSRNKLQIRNKINDTITSCSTKNK